MRPIVLPLIALILSVGCKPDDPDDDDSTASDDDYDTGSESGTIDPFDPVCGNVHFTPNGRQHYDLISGTTVMTSCENFGHGDEPRPFTSVDFADYLAMAQDCMGPFLVYWRQNAPGLDSGAVDQDGHPILNWWVYLYY